MKTVHVMPSPRPDCPSTHTASKTAPVPPELWNRLERAGDVDARGLQIGFDPIDVAEHRRQIIDAAFDANPVLLKFPVLQADLASRESVEPCIGIAHERVHPPVPEHVVDREMSVPHVVPDE